MSALQPEILERLGTDGLHRVLDDLLDKNRLVRLVTASGLKYDGMRVRSQTRSKLLTDLVARSEKDEATRRTILRTLQKELRPLARQWKAVADEEKARRLSNPTFLGSRGNLGKHLLLVAASEGEGDSASFEMLLARKHLLGLARNGNGAAEPTRPHREEQRLNKRIEQLEKKLKHLEGQLSKSRENERVLKRDLIQRKGELAEARMAGERQRRELERSRAEGQKSRAGRATPPGDGSSQVAKTLRRLSNEQKKLTESIVALPSRRTVSARLDASALGPVHEAIDQLRKELGSIRRDHGKQERAHLAKMENLDTQLVTALESVRKPRASKRSKSRDGTPRVGVFIDVQNVYYGARQLKGKLDFHALLEAATEKRRLIEATAYVVESKEIDQSGFIKLLEQRAIEVRRKTLQVRADGSTKGDWDMELALDILAAAPRLDVVVLVSGDGDFTSLVKRVKGMGPRVEVIGFPRTTAKALLEAADLYRPLDRKFMIYQRKPKVTPKGSKKSSKKDSAGPT
ncbi:MAG: NYN domain-containing protein [Acidobacteriota bacterium]|nr:NYN domain-containing protein [Acidobacteriota bacterium]